MSVYRIEIFDQSCAPVDFAVIPETTEIVEDYETLEAYTVKAPKIMTDVKAGYLFQILDENGSKITCGVIKGLTYEDDYTNLSCSCALALLDYDAANPRHDQESASSTYEGGRIDILNTANFLKGATLRLVDDLRLGGDPALYFYFYSTLASGSNVKKFNGLPAANLFEVWKEGRSLEGMTLNWNSTGFVFPDQYNPYTIFQLWCGATSRTLTIDADLPNCLERDVNVSSQNGAANCCLVYLYTKRDDEVTYVETRYYYRHPDGTVDQSNIPANIIKPIIRAYIEIQKDSSKTDAENYTICGERAQEALKDAEKKNEIRLTYSADDKVISGLLNNANAVTIKYHGVEYSTVYTGFRRRGKRITYYFGNARTELTAKLAAERRSK